MKRFLPFAVALLLVLGAISNPCLAQSCTELEQKVAELTKRIEGLERTLDLTKRVESLERSLAAPAAAQPKPAAAAAPSATGREDAMALYKRVDELVAAGKIQQANEELAAWDAKHAGTPEAGWTRALNRELAVVGKDAPTDWSIDHWYQGESDVKLNGKGPTLLVFWEAWCPHCKDEVPKMQALWEEYKPKGLQVVGVTRITQTATEESVKAFLAQSGVGYPMAKETGDLATYFAVQGIPAAALVKDGKIVWRGHPMRLTDELLTAWF